MLNDAVERSPVGELVDIMDVGFACAFLATPYRRRLTGQTMYVDAGQRTVLFLNVMRRRGNQYLEHMAQTVPHVLQFDGAWLVQNFENLNPANTLWSKQYNLYADIDTDAPRYPVFERWWGGHVVLTGEEMQYIVDNLFVGNKTKGLSRCSAGSGSNTVRKKPWPNSSRIFANSISCSGLMK